MGEVGEQVGNKWSPHRAEPCSAKMEWYKKYKKRNDPSDPSLFASPYYRYRYLNSTRLSHDFGGGTLC